MAESHIIKTKAQWDESGQSLTEYLQVGDKVDEEMFYYFLEVLPPASYSSRVVQIGEPYDHTREGWPTYMTLIKRAKGEPWEYAGVRTHPKHWRGKLIEIP